MTDKMEQAGNDWIRNPIDDFVWAKLNQSHLQPAPAASRLTLLRRATFGRQRRFGDVATKRSWTRARTLVLVVVLVTGSTTIRHSPKGFRTAER